jgi:hypothetical protein
MNRRSAHRFLQGITMARYALKEKHRLSGPSAVCPAGFLPNGTVRLARKARARQRGIDLLEGDNGQRRLLLN